MKIQINSDYYVEADQHKAGPSGHTHVQQTPVDLKHSRKSVMNVRKIARKHGRPRYTLDFIRKKDGTPVRFKSQEAIVNFFLNPGNFRQYRHHLRAVEQQAAE